MGARAFIRIVVVVMAIGCAHAAAWQAAPGDAFVGTWSGTWEGEGSSGGFQLTLDRGAEGRLGGRVAVTGEPAYEAPLRTVSFEQTRMTARYDFPPNDEAEIVLTATFTESEAKGTWSARVKTSGEEVASGTWHVVRK